MKHLAIFVNYLVENPTFDIQTKEHMTVQPSAFSSVKLSNKFLKLVEKSGVVDSVMSYAKYRMNPYHHGDMSLNDTIIGISLNYCGDHGAWRTAGVAAASRSSVFSRVPLSPCMPVHTFQNVNLLTPGGQFGTRHMGGKDRASVRYVFTKLEKITRAIFHPDGDDLLHYLNDEGLSIEPEYYMPVIPVVLMNGSNGISTGWPSTIQKYAPREILSNIRKMIQGEEPVEMHPHFSGYTGEARFTMLPYFITWFAVRLKCRRGGRTR